MHACQTVEHIQATRHASNQGARDFILADHSESIWQYLCGLKAAKNDAARASTPTVVHFILDNSGAELFMDLCLADWLISRGVVDQIVLHTKAYPWFISDAMEHDIRWMVDEALPALVERDGDRQDIRADILVMIDRWRGYLGGGRHGQVLSGGGVFELAPVIVALIGHTQLFEEEQYFLDIARSGSAKQLIHAGSPCAA